MQRHTTVWHVFMDIIDDLKLDYTSKDSITELKAKIISWFSAFLKIYQARDVTPCMHALCAITIKILLITHNRAWKSEKCNDRASK